MRVVNLTPNAIKVVHPHDPDRVNEYPPSGTICRVGLRSEQVGEIEGMPVFETQVGDVQNLPEQMDDVVYIVSRMVLECLEDDRDDLVAPGDAIRDHAGRVIGCRGFSL